ncbi:hypothetical protein PTTG_28616, partial [Puccinia triticina 1-1 BBBD Race 1]
MLDTGNDQQNISVVIGYSIPCATLNSIEQLACWIDFQSTTSPALDLECEGNKCVVMSNKHHKPSDLPPADRGWLAWRFALVAFVIDGIVWGPTLCYGI